MKLYFGQFDITRKLELKEICLWVKDPDPNPADPKRPYPDPQH